MGRGFGRGAKSVAIVTHAQVKSAGKKTPRGLRSVRQKKKQRYQKRENSQEDLEKSLGVGAPEKAEKKTLTQQIASINVPHIVGRREKGLKRLRKQVINAVKDVRRRHNEKAKRKLEKQLKREARKKK
ncbi:hypothetical protein AGDE_06879 [Angomonas deanei]|uniref:Uncharacterized protein n=1 Tax=Angomonas deanei TaxID=59799 RepID=S9V2U5_9TRYP|nr:hypothetical protein AGDE_09072 [Angomonas deanei]EPY35364.1 hypothetical protein AGDE_07420 [Angomonas deanei]EPY36515.1 hypothetical protein AGDE_06879 [Angomonas deanei]CAD2221677.1 hypothetical protein, conserved [Angomonas deanei]|eukprot:EPY31398.1 hypothetical protein AGDE_09072 [Angomonas deanei]